MNCCFEHTLHYSSPGHGDWGVVRIGMLAPESIQLFVCPSACGRHGAMGAMRQGFKDRLFYLYVDQWDIVRGYDDLIPEAVKEVLDAVKIRPKVVFIFVSCLDDLIGTDHEALLLQLGEEYPDIRFRVCHMNPISLGSRTPPPVSIQNNLYSLLEDSPKRDRGINCIGNLEAVADTSELYLFLKELGVESVRHISAYTTFSQYQEMSKSRANLVLLPAGRQAAQQLKERMGTDYLFLPVSYDLEEIEDYYRKTRQFLAPDMEEEPNLEPYKKKAVASIQAAKEKVGNLPIIIDASATVQPFGLAKALLSYGFHVVKVGAQEPVAFDKEHMEWIAVHHREVEHFQPQHHKAVLFEDRMEDSLSIGVESAYLCGSRHVADLFNDGGMFGYDGVCRLMKLISDAAGEETDLRRLIDGYGLVV